METPGHERRPRWRRCSMWGWREPAVCVSEEFLGRRRLEDVLVVRTVLFVRRRRRRQGRGHVLDVLGGGRFPKRAFRYGLLREKALESARLAPLEAKGMLVLGLVVHTLGALPLLTADFARTGIRRGPRRDRDGRGKFDEERGLGDDLAVLEGGIASARSAIQRRADGGRGLLRDGRISAL